MVGSVIAFLIYLCVIGLVFYLVLYVLRDVLGLPIPAKVVQILLAIFGLLAIYMLFQLLTGGGMSMPTLR